MASPSTRDDLIETAKILLWRDGYESMSPRKVLQESGAGQGSLYHHFSGKKGLALEALTDVSHHMIAELDDLFDDNSPPLVRLHAYLCKDRNGLRGCKLGRLSNESAFKDKDLRKPLTLYFKHLRKRLTECLEEAVASGELSPDAQSDLLADTIVSSVQGGYVLSRSCNDSKAVTRATEGLWTLIAAQSTTHKKVRN